MFQHLQLLESDQSRQELHTTVTCNCGAASSSWISSLLRPAKSSEG